MASGDEVPDLDLTPSCSICDGDLEYNGGFHCRECNVYWDSWGLDGERGEP